MNRQCRKCEGRVGILPCLFGIRHCEQCDNKQIHDIIESKKMKIEKMREDNILLEAELIKRKRKLNSQYGEQVHFEDKPCRKCGKVKLELDMSIARRVELEEGWNMGKIRWSYKCLNCKEELLVP